MRFAMWLMAAAALAACASTLPRAASTPHACMAAVRNALPPDAPDPRKHCLASAGIVLRCSSSEAVMAGWGKEIEDFFGHGDASSEDLKADAAGRACAKRSRDTLIPDEVALASCCEASGY